MAAIGARHGVFCLASGLRCGELSFGRPVSWGPDDVLLWLRPPLHGLTLPASKGCGQVSLRRNKPTKRNALTRESNECRLVVVPKIGHGQGQDTKSKSPDRLAGAFAFCGCLTMSYFRTEYTVLSSALRRFTALFGMGRGGTTSPWSSDIACRAISRRRWARGESS